MGKKGKKSKAKKQAYAGENKIAEYDANLIVKKIDDVELFKPHPPMPDCPICAIPLPVSCLYLNALACCSQALGILHLMCLYLSGLLRNFEQRFVNPRFIQFIRCDRYLIRYADHASD